MVCDRTTFSYESTVAQYNASISVIWDRNNIIDRTNITLYKCGLVGSYKGHPDCSLCMTRATDLGCVWCGTGADEWLGTAAVAGPCGGNNTDNHN